MVDIDFDKNKEDILRRSDKSRKGGIDKRIASLCSIINSKDDYFTLSSCSGRIFLIRVPEDNKKNNSEWLTMTHDIADKDDFSKALNSYKGDGIIYFRQEAPILHVCCRNIGCAQKLIETARNKGFKHSGIFSANKKIVAELIGADLHPRAPVPAGINRVF